MQIGKSLGTPRCLGQKGIKCTLKPFPFSITDFVINDDKLTLYSRYTSLNWLLYGAQRISAFLTASLLQPPLPKPLRILGSRLSPHPFRG
jgi:hypothetical protein